MEKENRITPSFISVPGGPVLGLTDTPLLDVDGLKFKDLERCGELLPYEDWRLSARERAEDLVSDIFIKAMTHYEQFDPARASVKTWLTNIARNALIDEYRKGSLRNHVSLDDEENVIEPSYEDEY